ncbi:MAG: outer membrane beta-barrel protein [Chitinophagaceae bacterium]|nr:outer membrane beta-barrel protein [Chitinophagaceae bacterium]
MCKPALLTCLFLLAIISAHAQQAIIRGNVSDSSEKRNLHFAVVSLLRKSDTTLAVFTRSNQDGKFVLPKIDTGQYVLLISFPRFADYMESLDVKADTDIGPIFLTQKSKLLEEVVIRSGSAIRIKGDTTEFMADSFKVKEGATVEDLLKKLPGFSVNSKGEIVAQGKRVDKVLVDGEEFFGDDPTMATQNISAKAVDRVQVFETKTEQQQLTGMTTGNEGKTVNIKLKENAKKGAFGKVIAGTDFTTFIDSKILYNKFTGKKKFSVYGTRTNVNAGSLNWEDRQKLGIDNDFEYDELSGYYFSFGGGDDFNDWNLRGLPDAYSAGSLFSNKWNADKQTVNLSYRFNSLGTTNTGTTLTQNILPTGLTYTNRYTDKDALNQQHALNGKYEWKLDSLASFKIVTTHTFKNSHTTGSDIGEFLNATRDTINRSFREYENNTKRNQTDNQFSYKQLFTKKNRVWQTVIRYGVTGDDNKGSNATKIRYFNNGVFNSADTIDQQKIFTGHSTTYGIKSTYIEPLSASWMLIVDYAYNKNHSVSKHNTFEKGFTGKYEILIADFSNNFEMDAFSHSGNAIFRYAGKKIKLGIGSGISTVKLGLQNLDNNTLNIYHFLNITPQAQLNVTPKPQTNFSFGYRGTTRQPTISQLQPLRDNTDPLVEYSGNPDLKVGFNHGFNLNFNEYKVLKQVYSYFYLNYNIQQNAITQFNSIEPVTGKRTYYPVNVNGNTNWNFGGNWNKGGGVFKSGNKKLQYGFGTNANGARNINFINSQKATTKSFSVNLNLRLGIESEDKFDFSISPSVGFNSSKSSLSSSIDNNYFTYGGRLDAEITLPWKLEVSTNLNADLRQRINAFATNTNLVIWNAGVSKNIFKKDAGKISFIANDILDDNQGFTRTINNTFISDDSFQRISRYFLLKFEWSFNKMPGGETK